MKMRFWQKTYIFTLILFLVCINLGILSLTFYTSVKTVKAAESAAVAEQQYMQRAFELDMNEVTDDGHSLLMKAYAEHYSSRGVLLAFFKDGEVFVASFDDAPLISDNTVAHRYIAGKRYILISSTVCDGKYDMLFAKDVDQLDGELRSLAVVFILTSLFVSALLAIVLYFILKKLSSPLEKLKNATNKVEKGDFSVRIEESGDDEFTSLARSFNSMTDRINSQMLSLERDAEAKQMLVNNMAHELRTPLTSIRGYAEYLEKANVPEERRAVSLAYIVSESKRLQRISQILLDTAFLENNTPEMSDVDVAKLLKECADALSLIASEKGIDLSLALSPMTVCGNETLLSMLFANLIENAIKACERGGKVMISCSDLAVKVTDDGKGMTPEQLLHITEPFYRTDRSRSRAEGGVGLGLTLCSKIVGLHNAQMSFASEIGKGTEVTLEFPKASE